jgi:unsaturated rhamnogalacturonyl hydrolase
MFNNIDKYIDKLISSEPNMPLWNVEKILQGKEAHWNYIDGVMINSLYQLYKVTNLSKYLDFIIKYIDYYVFEDGSIRGYDPLNFSTDDLCESRILFDLYNETKNGKYKKAIELSYYQVKNQPRTTMGNFWHKKIYPYQIWLDGLYMIQPFYVRYETVFGNKDYEDTIKQFINIRKLMFDDKNKLYYHGYDESKEAFWAEKKTGLSKNFWLRSIGWFLVGLVDCLDYMDEAMYDEFNTLKVMLKEAIDGILLYIDKESYMFWQVPNYPNREGNYLETSGSLMISYAIQKGVRLGLLPDRYQETGINIFNGVISKYLYCENDNIRLGGICLVAGLGPDSNRRRDGSYEYYISEPIVENDAKGVGPLIMAYTEIKRINNKVNVSIE